MIEQTLEDRGRTDSAFVGDNHFHQLKSGALSPIKRRKNISTLMNYDNNELANDANLVSSKRHYYPYVSQA